MLKSGTFKTEENTIEFIEIDEPTYKRFDALKPGATLNGNPDDVLYSIITARSSKEYGNKEYYEKFQSFQIKCAMVKKTTQTVTSWVDGVYVKNVISTNEKEEFHQEVHYENGVLRESTTSYGNESCTYATSGQPYTLRIQPANYKDYVTITVSKDTLNESTKIPFFSINTLRRRHNIEHIYENDFVVADTEEEARKRLKEWVNSGYRFKGFDTETTGTDVNLYGDDHLVGIILGDNPTKSTYFPFRHTSGVSNLSMEFLDELMVEVLKQQDKLVGHNKKFDRKVMMKEGYDLHIKWDTMWGSMILNPVIKKGLHEMKNLIYELTGKYYLELTDIFLSKSDINFAILPKEIILPYACPDATNVITLLEDQLTKIPEYQMRLFELENEMADICADMEYYGLRVDVEKYQKQYENCNYIIDTLEKAFRVLTHEDGNIQSKDNLRNIIYNKMGCKVYKRTKTNKPSVDSSVITLLGSMKADKPREFTEAILDMNGKEVISAKQLANSKYPAMVILAKYNEMLKLKTAFYSRFERTMSTGRVFFWINQWGAATGRQSSPMHQLPPELKDVILSDSPSKDFWGPDFSQIELRMIAYLAGEEKLIEMAKDPTKDVHRIIGSLISGLEMWQITPKMRSTGKRRNFGVVYLITAMGLAAQMFGPAYTKENVEFCQQQLDDFYNSFKRIDRYIKKNALLVQQRGYMETKWFHRVRVFPEIYDENLEPRKRNSILRMANNVPVQGTAADYLKLAEVQMYHWIYARGWNKLGDDGFPLVRMMLSIHDELIISSDRSIPYEEIITMITKCMETPVKGAPPFSVQPALMSNWGEHSNDAVAMPIKLRDKLIEDYLRTGESVINHDNYMEVLDKFRSDNLHQYMDGLIKQYGNEAGKHVRDGALTFELLDLYSKELKPFKDLDQEHLIDKATELYIENNGSAIPDVEEAVAEKRKEEVNYSSLETLVEFDKDGNVVYPEQADETEDDDDFDEYASTWSDDVNVEFDKKPTYVWTLYDTLVLDAQEIPTQDKVDDLLKHVFDISVKDGFYKVSILYGGQLLDTKMNVEEFNTDELNDYVMSLIGGVYGNKAGISG